MSKLVSNPVVLALIAAVTTSVLGYLINQLPEVPNKQDNVGWIIGAVVVVTLVVWVVAVLQTQQNGAGTRTVVRSNTLRGKRNRLSVRTPDADVSKNVLDGDDQELTVELDSTSPGSPPGGTP